MSLESVVMSDARKTGFLIILYFDALVSRILVVLVGPGVMWLVGGLEKRSQNVGPYWKGVRDT